MQYSSFASLHSKFDIQYSIFNIRHLILFLIFPFLIQQNFAQTTSELGSPFIQNYTAKEYNASSQNWDIVQDKRGVMYFGNSQGVLEFDGNNWNIIEVTNNSVVRSLSIDKNGTIFVGAIGEFGYLASNPSGKLIYISLKNKLKESDKKFNDIWEICSTTHGIYFLTLNKIFRFYNDTINILPSEHSSNEGFVINDELFVVQRDSGMYKVKDDIFQLLPFCKEFTSGFGRIVVLPYSDKKILIGTQYKGFYIYDIGMLSSIDDKYENVSSSILKKITTEIDEYINHHDLYSGVKINNNHYAFATLSGGIIIMDKNGKLVRIINKNRGLQNNAINNLYFDKNQNLWAVLDNGISEIEISSPISKFDKLSGLEDLVSSIIRYNNKLYVNSMNGIFYLPNYKMNIINDKFNFKHISNTRLDCWDFISVKDTKRKYDFLLASVSQGFVQIHDTLSELLFEKEKIYSFCQSKKFPNHIFLGLADGLASIEINPTDICQNLNHNKTSTYFNNNKEVKFIYNGKFNSIIDLIYNIVCDDKGNLWLTAIYNGIIHIKFNSNDINDFQIIRYDTLHGLPQLDNNFIYFINNNLYVATQKGIYKPVLSSGADSNNSIIKFVPDTSFGKIFNEQTVGITQIYADTEDEIIVFSDIGIGTLTKNKNKTYKWNSIPFKKISTASTYIFFVEQNGIIWISTLDGLLRYDPEIKKNYYAQFNSLIRNVTIGNDSVIYYGTYFNDSVKKDNHFIFTSLIQPEQLIPELSYEHNSITFEFSTTFYEKASANRFKYILEGFDKDWSNWTDETKKEYTNLPEGTYYFKVIAKNIFDVESTKAVYKFTIYPPWHRTYFAYFCYLLLLVSLFYIGIKLNIKRLKAANLQLENIVIERTAEIFQQKEEIQTQAEELEKLSIVASEINNAVLIMDSKGNFEWVNDGFSKLHGITLKQLLDKGKNIVDSSANPDIKDIIRKCIDNKKFTRYESLFISNSGKEIWTQTTLTPILDNDENVVKIIAIESDISKIKKVEEEIEIKNKLLEKKNIQITDSISYAKCIQEAIIPSEDLIKLYFPDSFVYFRPKDIVSGDFYWLSEQKGKLILAVVDCTGHGVPGAFMSMIGNTLLNEIVNEKKILKPSLILDKLNNGVIYSLDQGNKNEDLFSQQKSTKGDGMDISLCNIDMKNKEIQIASANHTVYIIKDKKINTIDGDIYSIGGMFAKKANINFTNHTINIEKGTTIYLFTDGFKDQLGEKTNNRFSTNSFKNLLLKNQHLSMDEQLSILDNTFKKWKGKRNQIDDILIVGIKFS
ncbi:MAG: SpoIIE family protein phosphatase [Bacteroidales bacterium]|nr:SpoIIE family protein phosphatase [Bacteroidales bacterium]